MSLEEFKNFLKAEQKLSPAKIEDILHNFTNPLSFFDFCLFLYDERYCSISHFPEEEDD